LAGSRTTIGKFGGSIKMNRITEMLGLSMAFFLCTLFETEVASSDVPLEVVEGLDTYKMDVHRYENIINRDHFYWVGNNISLVFSDFNFSNYRYDGFVGDVLQKPGFNFLLEKYPEISDRILKVYHGYHKDMKHNYFSKPWEPSFEGPSFYCMRQPNLLNATNTLWTLDGQPIDANGNLGYDTIYTTDLVERDLPNVEDYVMYRVLCYTWDSPPTDDAIKASGETPGVIVPFAHANYHRMRRLYQYFNEHNQDHYYKLDYDHSEKDRANFQNVIAFLLHEAHADGIRDCEPGKELVAIYEAYNAAGTDTMIFVGEQNYKTIAKKDGLTLTNKTLLGYAAISMTNGCRARYAINVRIRLNNDLIQHGNSTQQGENYHDRDVYLAPDALNTTDLLYHKQVFYVW